MIVTVYSIYFVNINCILYFQNTNKNFTSIPLFNFRNLIFLIYKKCVNMCDYPLCEHCKYYIVW